jgi:hypothetical protein
VTDAKTLIGECLLVVTAILPLVFRHLVWLRALCIVFILFATVFACGRVHVAPRMAVDRLQAEKPLPSSEEFRQGFVTGSRYSHYAAMTAVPIFLLCVAALTVLAIIPPKPRGPKNPNDRNV